MPAKRTKKRTAKRRGKVPQTNIQLKPNSNCKQKGDRWRILHTHMKKREECRANVFRRENSNKKFHTSKSEKKEWNFFLLYPIDFYIGYRVATFSFYRLRGLNVLLHTSSIFLKCLLYGRNRNRKKAADDLFRFQK